MEKFQTLASTLGVDLDPKIAEYNEAVKQHDHKLSPLDPDLSPRDFCRQVVASPEFRRYLLNGFVLGDLPPAVVCRVLDHAWGRPVERHELSGPDGDPIITEVRRVIVRAKPVEDILEDDDLPAKTRVTH